jgi:hypothetical protein
MQSKSCRQCRHPLYAYTLLNDVLDVVCVGSVGSVGEIDKYITRASKNRNQFLSAYTAYIAYTKAVLERARLCVGRIGVPTPCLHKAVA